MFDIHNNVRAIRALSPVSIVSATTTAGKVIDRRGFNSVEFVIGYGAVAATGCTLTPLVKEGDATGTMTSVADADLLGTESGAAIAAAASRTSGTSQHIVKRLGYKGTKRYVSCSLVSVAATATAAAVAGIAAILGHPENAPVAT